MRSSPNKPAGPCHHALCILIPLTLCCLALVSGCGGKHYTTGRGDVGKFILQHAVDFGGRPVTTNGLPVIIGDWKYVQDEFGIGIVLPPAQYQPVQDFVRAAFGPPSSSAGWSARDFGVAIMVQQAGGHTDIGIYPPMSDEKMGRALRTMTEAIEKNTK